MGQHVSTLQNQLSALQHSKWSLQSPNYRPANLLCPPTSLKEHEGPEEDLGAVLRPMISSFASNIGYTSSPPEPSAELWIAMRAFADQLGVNYDEGTHSWKCFRVGISYAAVCLPKHPLEVQVYVGTYSWLGLLLDDETAKSPDDFSRFVQCFALGERQPTPLLEGWAELMRLSFKYWDPVVANFIVSSSMNFVNANVLETRDEFKKLEPTRGGKSWPWFLRDKDGVAEAYAWFTFPKIPYDDMSNYLEMIPDLSSYIALTNDILSFYKEEKNGDKDNYVHSRGWLQMITYWVM
ncbi:hypothetical protein CkaCkLH20_02268 [Colletotrichum karsti]|uniref:Trichodiene synthase n=1 Tax=Colletotrichum karsti TaxID=1095194 RepID=A0A9P6ID74_9PEZI|nr:uncharacterized protein CkaCkLH20_02268 [Colletotrichum karsti]KAF9880314.1 hypothetical protein CkaCkLH20_02268 [Colletotrichum karsti]